MSDPTKERTGEDHPSYVDVLRTYSEDKVRAIKQSTIMYFATPNRRMQRKRFILVKKEMVSKISKDLD